MLPLLWVTFSLFWWLPFHFFDGSLWAKVFNFSELQLICVFFCCLWFWCIIKKSLSNPKSWRFTPIFPPKSFLVSALIFRSLIHFALIFIFCVKYRSKFIVLNMDIQLPHDCLLERLFFSHWMVLAPSLKISWPQLRGFITVLLIIAKRWKQHQCPSIDEWIK